jgi:hypothetical protein
MPGLEGLESGIREPSYKGRVGLWLRQETRWSRRLPGTERSPGREAGFAWPGGGIPFISWLWGKARYHSFLSLVLFRWMTHPL